MVKLPLFLSLLFLLPGKMLFTDIAGVQPSTAQSLAPVEASVSAEEIMKPEFPGGEYEMLKFLAKNAKYPTRAQLTKTSGLVMMQATIDEEGKLKDIKAAYSDSPLLEKEPLRVLQLMPKWEPAKKKGKAVSSTYLFPFVFNMASAAGNNEELLKDKCIKFSEGILANAPDLLYVADEVVITGLGVVR